MKIASLEKTLSKIMFLLVVFFSFGLTKKNKQTVNIAWDNFPRSFDPRYANDANSQYLENLVHCPLIDFSHSGETKNNLAKSLRWLSPKVLEVKVHDYFRFSDGSKVGLADVLATYEFFMKKNMIRPSPRSLAFQNVKSINLVDDKIIFELHNIDAAFQTNLVVGILPEAIARGGEIQDPLKIKSCGPFVLKSITLNNISLTRNPYYQSFEPLKLSHSDVKIKVVKDETTRFAKLQKGEVDIVQNGVSLEKVSSLASNSNLKLLRGEGLKTTYVGFNLEDKILRDKKVRKAIGLAINKEAINKYILKGLALPATTMVTPSSPYYNKNQDYIKFDRKVANKMLDESGYKIKSGEKYRFQLSYKTTKNDTRYAIAKAIQGDLYKVGIKLDIQTLEWGRFKSDVEKGLVQLWGLSWVGFKDPDIYRYVFSSKSFPPLGGNRGRYKNLELDRLLEKGKETVDLSERKLIYAKVQEIIEDDMPYIFLFHEDNYALVRKDIKNFTLYADGRYASLAYTYK